MQHWTYTAGVWGWRHRYWTYNTDRTDTKQSTDYTQRGRTSYREYSLWAGTVCHWNGWVSSLLRPTPTPQHYGLEYSVNLIVYSNTSSYWMWRVILSSTKEWQFLFYAADFPSLLVFKSKQWHLNLYYVYGTLPSFLNCYFKSKADCNLGPTR